MSNSGFVDASWLLFILRWIAEAQEQKVQNMDLSLNLGHKMWSLSQQDPILVTWPFKPPLIGWNFSAASIEASKTFTGLGPGGMPFHSLFNNANWIHINS